MNVWSVICRSPGKLTLEAPLHCGVKTSHLTFHPWNVDFSTTTDSGILLSSVTEEHIVEIAVGDTSGLSTVRHLTWPRVRVMLQLMQRHPTSAPSHNCRLDFHQRFTDTAFILKVFALDNHHFRNLINENEWNIVVALMIVLLGWIYWSM